MALTELETIEDEAKQARHRLVRGGYEMVFAGAATYVAIFVFGWGIWSIILLFAAFISTLVGLVDVLEGGTRHVLARREARELKRLPAARVHRLPP